MVLPCPRCQKNNENPSRGEAAPGLSAHIPNDTQIGPNLIPKWLQNWSQNGVRNGLNIALVLMMLFGSKRSPKMDPKWYHKGSQKRACTQELPRGAPGAQNGPQNVSKSYPRRSRSPEWTQNASKMGRCAGTPIVMDPGLAECAKRLIISSNTATRMLLTNEPAGGDPFSPFVLLLYV